MKFRLTGLRIYIFAPLMPQDAQIQSHSTSKFRQTSTEYIQLISVYCMHWNTEFCLKTIMFQYLKCNTGNDSFQTICVDSFIHQWLYKPLLGPGLFLSFINFFVQSVGPLGRAISPSQGRYLYAEQHKHRINTYTDIHALSGIRTHDSSIRAREDSSCLRPICVDTAR
jgi:hypothetical protein